MGNLHQPISGERPGLSSVARRGAGGMASLPRMVGTRSGGSVEWEWGVELQPRAFNRAMAHYAGCLLLIPGKARPARPSNGGRRAVLAKVRSASSRTPFGRL